MVNRAGRRNIWTADAPAYSATQLTHYTDDDGQELTWLALTPDGGTAVYVRGGDHDGNWSADPPNPASAVTAPTVQIWTVSTRGGAEPKLLADGDEPAISPAGDRVAFLRSHQVWIVPTDGSAPAKELFHARGEMGSLTWSPDGTRLAFVADRGDHSFVGVYTTDSTTLRWLAPSTSRDEMPRWSPDGSRIAFVRLPGRGGAPVPSLRLTPRPWAIWTADVASGAGRRLWESPVTLRGSYPTTDGGANLAWAAGERIVFLTDLDGWPHLYAMSLTGGDPLLLTPGPFMAEFISLSPDRQFLVYAANTGADSSDGERRHIFRVPVDRAEARALSSGAGVEWAPVVTGDGKSVAWIGAGTSTPPLPMIASAEGGAARTIGAEQARDFPVAGMVVPRPVVFRSSDGLTVHGQLFQGAGAGRRPAVVFVHGGPPRQMLLGWHYMEYYSHAYAINQYLASHGYTVLSVNYRLGVGYGHEFHHPEQAGPWGASEYRDVKAGGEYLRSLAAVDPSRIGIWGGSYGGLLTALALARDSRLFRTGVDFHGVHDWPTDMNRWQESAERTPYEPNDSREAMATAWRSSPAADVKRWTSPVLLIHGDDDRNVAFHQTVELGRRLADRGVRFEELVLPDEIHGFLRHASWLAADRAMVAWFGRELAGQ